MHNTNIILKFRSSRILWPTWNNYWSVVLRDVSLTAWSSMTFRLHLFWIPSNRLVNLTLYIIMINKELFSPWVRIVTRILLKNCFSRELNCNCFFYVSILPKKTLPSFLSSLTPFCLTSLEGWSPASTASLLVPTSGLVLRLGTIVP